MKMGWVAVLVVGFCAAGCASDYGVRENRMMVGKHETYTRSYYRPAEGPGQVLVGEMRRIDGTLVYVQGCIPDAPTVLSDREISAVHWTSDKR